MKSTNTIHLGPRAWLVAYDIRDHRRLARVHRRMKKWGVPLQRSLFVVFMSDDRADVLAHELRELIDEAVDDVRLYHLPAKTECYLRGRSTFPGWRQLPWPVDDNYLGRLEA
jgi:CRISPR-associated protein Cas2